MDTSQLPGRGIKPLLSLKKHYRISLVIWLVVVLAGLPVAWIKGQSFYAVESVFQVSPNYMKTLATDKEIEFQSNSQYREFVNHLSTTVTRFDVLERALKKLREARVDVQPKGLTERKFIERLQKTVTVRAMADTYMVRIGMEGPQKEQLDDIINAITQSFLETTKTEQLFGSVERAQALQTTLDTLQAEIAVLETKRLPLSELLGLTTFGENVVNPFDAMLAQSREKSNVAVMERAQAEATLAAFLSQRETPLSAGRSMLEMRLQDNGLQALRNEVIKRSEEINRTVSGLEDQHPAKKPALAEADSINQRLQARELAFDQSAFDNLRRRLTASLQQTRFVEAQAQKATHLIAAQSAGYARNFQQAMRITGDIRKREQELKDVRDRLNYLHNESSAIGFVRLVTPALPAVTPQGVGKVKLLLLVFVLACVLALVAPVALDMIDRRIYTVNEAEKLIGIAAAGWQVDVQDLPTELYAAEQTRRFVTTLLRNKARAQKQVFAFTSVKSRGGTTGIVLDTAAVLQALGIKVLVVEANSFSPSPRFDQTVNGLSAYLSGRADAASMVQTVTHQAQALSVVGFGIQLSRGIQRLDLLNAAVRQWEKDYEFVLIDLPPVLISADAELLIQTLGQVFMVLEAQSVTQGEAIRAKRMLQKLDPEAVGLFVNRIPLFHGAGYMEELMVETLTGRRFSQFMSLSQLKFNFEMWRLRWQQLHMRKK